MTTCERHPIRPAEVAKGVVTRRIETFPGRSMQVFTSPPSHLQPAERQSSEDSSRILAGLQGIVIPRLSRGWLWIRARVGLENESVSRIQGTAGQVRNQHEFPNQVGVRPAPEDRVANHLEAMLDSR